MQILSDNTAAAIYYGKEDLDDYPYTVLFYNVGAYYAQATVA